MVPVLSGPVPIPVFRVVNFGKARRIVRGCLQLEAKTAFLPKASRYVSDSCAPARGPVFEGLDLRFKVTSAVF